MTKKPQRLPDYLRHIAEAIGRIQTYILGMDETAFRNNELVQDGVIRNLEVIGEASRNIERDHESFSIDHPELPLAMANDMRNALIHGYFEVDLRIVWRVINDNLPPLLALVEKMLESNPEENSDPVDKERPK